MLKLKFQYVGHLMQRADSSEKTLILQKTEGEKGGEQQQVRQLASLSMDWSLSKLWETVEDREAKSATVHRGHSVGQDIVTIRQQDCSPPGSSVLYCLLEFAQVHVH